MPPGAAGDTAGSCASWGKGHLGAGEKGREGTRRRQGRACARRGQCLGRLELVGITCQKAQMEPDSRGPQRGSQGKAVSSREFFHSASRVHLCSCSGIGRYELLQAVGSSWARSDVGDGCLQGPFGISSFILSLRWKDPGALHTVPSAERECERRKRLGEGKDLAGSHTALPPHVQPGPGFGKWSPRTSSCK